ncbi:MAG: phosphoribosylformylglycinamidine synthase subunit PurQ [Oscillatoriales cyanobacterium RM1_1_9]|nr:phosphoribosylformylglycinamidine synthase subunit PurQ [Oscillatoriales cyanobacterium SM2_3_0]NJO45155.1 phosphoribosylformylglycinamidine synthase subunit PurQ [Oscillatoriales cyanobacterium RM2_1_1]NJO71951.1 phosphoribosylformylglycinamidine synthase subunit PurQ [Oscillatoriales cyanobacterium RM1_1_9]
MKFGVIVFPGSNCDRDVSWVTQGLLQQPTRMVWHQETDVSDLDVVIIPGGFSYGDYLRCGAIAQFSPVMKGILDHANQGKLVIGICNGFQILTEVGLLPGALMRNRDLHFICDRVPTTIINANTPWTRAYTEAEVITLPIAHGEGCYYADPEILADLEANHQVVLRYGSSVTPEAGENPNGSLNNIAGICNPQGNVFGLMPHPERASDAALGLTDGLRVFKGLVGYQKK